MKELLDRWRADVLLSAGLCIVVGVVIMIWPAMVTLIVGKTIGIVLLIRGAAHCLSYLNDRESGRLGLASGAVIFALGALLLFRPPLVAQMMALVVGAILIMHGFEDIRLGLEGRQYGDERWWICLLVAVITIVLGIVVIWKYFQLAEITAWLMGAVLVFDGLGDILIVLKVVRAIKRANVIE